VTIQEISDLHPAPPPRRAPRPVYGKRPIFRFRITAATRQRLIESVKLSGRSLSEEIEHRIEQSFRRDDEQDRLACIERQLADIHRIVMRPKGRSKTLWPSSEE
jgi:hypothetical protein